MRRSTLALACLCALPYSTNAATALDSWKLYAQRAMTPGFAWAAPVAARAPSVIDSQRERFVRDVDAAVMVALSPTDTLRIRFDQGSFGFETLDDKRTETRSLMPFASSYAATTLVHSVGAASALSLTAIVAEQRFATPGFGSKEWQGASTGIGLMRHGSRESSSGSGVRIALDRKVAETLGWNLTLQSRLNMDAFKTYRGVYSDAGDFDVPGFVQTGLSWSPAPRTKLSVDVQRVFFSEVDTFTSAALPVRFLALLGDGSSPEFAWRDQTVLSIEAARFTSSGGRWSLRYSTQQQPRPTSEILDRALSDQYSDLNLALGFEQRLGAFGKLQFAASYSPASYFLGSSPFVQHDFDGGSQVEFDARWALSF